MSKEEIQRLKDIYKTEALGEVRKKIADAMVTYEGESIPYLLDCVNGEALSENREYLLKKIAELKGTKK